MCRSVWQTPLASIRTSTSPGPGGSSSSSATAKRPLRGQDCAAIHDSSRSPALLPAEQREREIGVGHEVPDHGLDAFLPADREPVGVRAVRAGPRRRPSASAFSTSAPRRMPPSIRTTASRPTARAHLDQRVERGHRAVHLAAAVVRDDDRRRLRARTRARASSAASTPFTSSGSSVWPRSQSRSSQVRSRFGNVASIAAAAASGSSSGGRSSRLRKTGSEKNCAQPSPERKGR